MNRSELRELAHRPGHSIGGHGAHHLSFSAHAADVVRRDVRENRILLETTIGRIVTSFAYPFGDYDDASVEIVGHLGYRVAVTCVPNPVRPGADLLRLPRLAVNPTDVFEDRLRVVFAEASGVA